MANSRGGEEFSIELQQQFVVSRKLHDLQALISSYFKQSLQQICALCKIDYKCYDLNQNSNLWLLKEELNKKNLLKSNIDPHYQMTIKKFLFYQALYEAAFTASRENHQGQLKAIENVLTNNSSLLGEHCDSQLKRAFIDAGFVIANIIPGMGFLIAKLHYGTARFWQPKSQILQRKIEARLSKELA